MLLEQTTNLEPSFYLATIQAFHSKLYIIGLLWVLLEFKENTATIIEGCHCWNQNNKYIIEMCYKCKLQPVISGKLLAKRLEKVFIFVIFHELFTCITRLKIRTHTVQSTFFSFSFISFIGSNSNWLIHAWKIYTNDNFHEPYYLYFLIEAPLRIQLTTGLQNKISKIISRLRRIKQNWQLKSIL